MQKEMYTFDDKGGRSITLRPEGTSGAARAFLENGLSNEALPQKICYLTSCYRYESRRLADSVSFISLELNVSEQPHRLQTQK